MPIPSAFFAKGLLLMQDKEHISPISQNQYTSYDAANYNINASNLKLRQ